MASPNLIRGIILSLALAVLAACDSAEERAEGHYQNGLELLQSGDVDRALVEFRNVLALDDFHVDARRVFAETVRSRGDFSSAYANFLRIAEDNPNDLQARLALSQMAVEALNWSEAERHSSILIESNPELEGVDVIDLVMRFRQAALADDNAALEVLTEEAIALSEANPDDLTVIRMAIEGLMRENRVDDALVFVDRGIAIDPESPFFYAMKSSILANNEDYDALETHLRETVQAFPDDSQTKGILVRLLTGIGQPERAEEFLREQIDRTENGVELQVALIGFLREVRGIEAALAETERAVERFENSALLKALRSGLLFDSGERDVAISELQKIIDNAQPEDDGLNGFKITLAQMLIANGNEVGARQLVGEVLEQDPSQADALKLNAAWLIDGDEVDEAIGILRRALDQAPQDADALTLMARAHQRAGEPELAQDMLSLAAEASGYAPAETLRFARTLLAAGRLRPAEDALIRGLRQAPNNLSLLQNLGAVYLRSEEWPRALQVESTLRREGSTQAKQLADGLRLQVLVRRDGPEKAISELESMAEGADADLTAQVALLREKLRAGDGASALEIANTIIAQQPNEPRIAMVLGSTYLALQDYEKAEATFTELTQVSPEFERGWIQLMITQSAQGLVDEARQTLEKALVANPAAPNLLWAQATFLEQSNDIDGAIGIYETLYQQDSNRLIVANNLASLLATYKDDEESLERAYAIARRLRGTDIPPFQDTYGWLLHRRGNSAEAIEYLEPAAEALASDAIVQFHLASAYEANERLEDALETYQRAIEVAGENDERAQIELARAAVERLTSAPTDE